MGLQDLGSLPCYDEGICAPCARRSAEDMAAVVCAREERAAFVVRHEDLHPHYDRFEIGGREKEAAAYTKANPKGKAQQMLKQRNAAMRAGERYVRTAESAFRAAAGSVARVQIKQEPGEDDTDSISKELSKRMSRLKQPTGSPPSCPLLAPSSKRLHISVDLRRSKGLGPLSSAAGAGFRSPAMFTIIAPSLPLSIRWRGLWLRRLRVRRLWQRLLLQWLGRARCG